MKWFTLARTAVGLTIATLAALVLIAISEASFRESSQAALRMQRAHEMRAAVSRLLRIMVDAETGQRGYLLTGDQSYLDPYRTASAEVAANLSAVQAMVNNNPGDRAEFETLKLHILRKQSEMDLTVRMRQERNHQGWKFVLASDVGQQHMNVIRAQADSLMANSEAEVQASIDKIHDSLLLARIGIAAMTLSSLLAFLLYLMQARALLLAGKREQDNLARERDLLERQVGERTATLAELATHLQQVREDERGHLARELHDELGALLTAAKLDVARIKSRLGSSYPEAAERLEHLTATLNSGIALKRRIVEDLRPSSLSHLGLVASLEILSREFAERSGLAVNTELESVELGGSAQLTIYRLVQESLTNIGKYAQAQQINVILRNETDLVCVEVNDDGKGFNTGKIASTSHGLSGMRHRVEAAGGHLKVVSAEGRGTRIVADLPKNHS